MHSSARSRTARFTGEPSARPHFRQTRRLVGVLLACLVGLGTAVSVAQAEVPVDNKVDGTCRKDLHKTSSGLVRRMINEARKCHNGRLDGRIPSATDCNDDANAPSPVGIARELSKITRRSDKSCEGSLRPPASDPATLGFLSCPAPCNAIPINNVYDDVVTCLTCQIERLSEAVSVAAYGTPSLPATQEQRLCQNALANVSRNYLLKRMKIQERCQTNKDFGKESLATNCKTADPRGQIARERAKFDALLRAKCSDAVVATLSGCGNTADAQIACSLAAVEATADGVFDAVYPPIPNPPTPTEAATTTPTSPPSETPTELPTTTPTDTPTDLPTNTPTETPTDVPTSTPTDTPTELPTATATDTATAVPTDTPTATPSVTPTATATPRALGVACTSGEQCGSGNCVDGVCCSSASCDSCYACNVPESAGTCTQTQGAFGQSCCGGSSCNAGFACNLLGVCECSSGGFTCGGVCCSFGQQCESGACVNAPTNACLQWDTTVRDGGTCLTSPCPKTCREILQAFPSAQSGVYMVQPARAAAPFAVRCDMTRDGGGWTLVGYEPKNQPVIGTSATGVMAYLGQEGGAPASIASGSAAGYMGPRFTFSSEYSKARINYCKDTDSVQKNRFLAFTTPEDLFANTLRVGLSGTIQLSDFTTNDSALDALISTPSDARFCRAAVYSTVRPGDTSWAVKDDSDGNFACGCNSGGWAGVGAYYGGIKPSCTQCSCFGGGWAGTVGNGTPKGGLNHNETFFWIR